MLMSLFQVGGSLTPEQMEALQSLGVDAGAPAAGGMFGALAGIGIGVMVVFGIIAIIVAILALINLYHLVMTDKASFEKVGSNKKKWYYNLILIPCVSGLIMVIPFIGWVLGAIGYIYSFVMILVYFFSMRKKAV